MRARHDANVELSSSAMQSLHFSSGFFTSFSSVDTHCSFILDTALNKIRIIRMIWQWSGWSKNQRHQKKKKKQNEMRRSDKKKLTNFSVRHSSHSFSHCLRVSFHSERARTYCNFGVRSVIKMFIRRKKNSPISDFFLPLFVRDARHRPSQVLRSAILSAFKSLWQRIVTLEFSLVHFSSLLLSVDASKWISLNYSITQIWIRKTRAEIE